MDGDSLGVSDITELCAAQHAATGILASVPDLPISKSQLDKLGHRLRDAQQPAQEDLDLLATVLESYREALQTVRTELLRLDLRSTARLKTISTTLDKLRLGISSLGTIHDLAGARVVVGAGYEAQDRTAARIKAAFTGAVTPRVIDRRHDPRSGYRAVHVVVVRIGNIPVEIQVRTELQDFWAQIFERLGDVWGRQIRYGGVPDEHPRFAELSHLRGDIVALMMKLSAVIARAEAAGDPAILVAAVAQIRPLLLAVTQVVEMERRKP
jgi:ppGpp synthetase/RelA/SpoT-type nucleotidyltranferase